MNKAEIEKLKEYLQSDKFKESVLARVEEDHKNLCRVARENYPEHKDHELKRQEGDWKYFDAMFVSVAMECSCGQVLTITREMTGRDQENRSNQSQQGNLSSLQTST